MVIPDGTYDVIVVEADDEAQPGPAAGAVHLSVTILSGEHKSEVVDLVVTQLARPGYDLLGLPGTLTVADGRPHLAIDD